MKLKAWLVSACVGALGLALFVEAALSTNPNGRGGFLLTLLRDHGLALAISLLVGALPMLFVLVRHVGRERRGRAATEAREVRRTAAHLAEVEEIHDANRLVTVGKLAAMAHEMGTPLSVVQAHAQMIAGGEATGAELRKDAEIILQQTRRMTNMVREVLELARHRVAFDTRVDLRRLTEQAISMIEPAAREHHVRARIVEVCDAAVARGDASKLLQILTNLGNNAIEAMPDGGALTFTVGSRRAISPMHALRDSSSEYLYVDVRDQGTGIPANQMPHLFDTFFTTKKGGSGLGLSVSYRIADEHGGWIAVESEPGKGSCFTLFLPPAPATPSERG